jgi:hypothetical protein
MRPAFDRIRRGDPSRIINPARFDKITPPAASDIAICWPISALHAERAVFLREKEEICDRFDRHAWNPSVMNPDPIQLQERNKVLEVGWARQFPV